MLTNKLINTILVRNKVIMKYIFSWLWRIWS